MIKYFFVFLLYFFNIKGLSQNNLNNRIKQYELPIINTLISSFYVNDHDQVIVPLNGGIYLVKEALWLIPPNDKIYYTSIAPSINDSAFFLIGNTKDSSELYYYKVTKKIGIQKFLLQKFIRGNFNLILKNDICFIWGYDYEGSRIGILSNDQIKWLYETKNLIQQVQVKDSSEIYFAIGNSIFQLSKHQKILLFNMKIWGFDILSNGDLIFSSNDGIIIKTGNEMKVIVKSVSGLVNCEKNNIYIIPTKSSRLYEISLQP